MWLPLRRQFLHEIELDRASVAMDEVAEMLVRARLHRAPHKLEDVFAGNGRIEVELPAGPVGRDADRGVRREPVPLALAAVDFGFNVRQEGGYPRFSVSIGTRVLVQSRLK
jgi:hypothetical protein